MEINRQNEHMRRNDSIHCTVAGPVSTTFWLIWFIAVCIYRLVMISIDLSETAHFGHLKITSCMTLQ